MTIGPSMANLVQYYGRRSAYGLSVSPNPLNRNPSYEPLVNPDQALRDNEIQYVVWDTFSASRSPKFSEPAAALRGPLQRPHRAQRAAPGQRRQRRHRRGGRRSSSSRCARDRPARRRAGPAASHGAAPAPATPIEHFVVLMQENHSFDNYFGTFPGADGIPRGTCMPVGRARRPCVRPFHLGAPLEPGPRARGQQPSDGRVHPGGVAATVSRSSAQ